MKHSDRPAPQAEDTGIYRLLLLLLPKKLRPLVLRFREFIDYVFFGVLTTLINLIVYYPLSRLIPYLAANVVAWIFAATFAFITNRLYVFRAGGGSAKQILYEIITFYGARLTSLGLEELMLYLLIEKAGMNADLVKLLAQVVVILFNYFASKFVVFRKDHRAN